MTNILEPSNTPKLKIYTSNPQKIADFQSFGLKHIEAVKGPDLKEVMADADTVIAYKAIEAGPNMIVEDTILVTDKGEEIVDIRYKLNEMKSCEGVAVNWQTRLAYHNGDQVYVFLGQVSGTLISIEHLPEGAFGFDPYFVPNKSTANGMTLFELDKIGEKFLYSARAGAVRALIGRRVHVEKPLSDYPAWTGEYQK